VYSPKSDVSYIILLHGNYNCYHISHIWYSELYGIKGALNTMIIAIALYSRKNGHGLKLVSVRIARSKLQEALTVQNPTEMKSLLRDQPV
jgi:hypothetical protein